ncbi:hypothetical protein [Paenibacillus wenxiniae]|uniref:Uncharacterized protein n=1 Tax=Paenibacillus wenxiniae TaxID=1636843 RepID=A0ABW4RI75_9BACL
MKREVAEERMSRYLDGDLNGEDTKELFRYMDEHPDAAETFRIMTALSLRLEKLPDVKPRYSLVDAILPQLDELDAQRRTDSAAEIGIMERQKPEVDEVAERRRQRGNWRDRLPVRTIGGIVAAGVVLGISIASYEPKTLTDAGPEASPYRYNETGSIGQKDSPTTNPEQSSSPKASDSTGKSQDTKKDPSNATDAESSSNEPSDGKKSTDTPESTKSDQPQQQENSTKTTPPQSESNSSDKGQQTPSSGNRGGVPTTTDKGNSPSTDNSGTAGTTPDKQTDKGSSAANSGNDGSDKARSLTTPPSDPSTTNPESTNSGEATGSTNSSTLTPSDGQPNQIVPEGTPSTSGTSTPSTDSPSTPSSTGTNNNGAGSASVNSLKTEQEWKSPSQDYTVVLTTNNTLRLDSIAADNVNGRSVVSSIPLKGTWIAGKWSDDGKEFTYQVNENGINKTYKITVGN